jgi:hypothetical protein
MLVFKGYIYFFEKQATIMKSSKFYMNHCLSGKVRPLCGPHTISPDEVEDEKRGDGGHGS